MHIKSPFQSFIYRFLIVFLLLGFKGFGQENLILATKIESNNFDNLYQVTPTLYRSDQPNKSGMKELEKLGIKTVLNLRNRFRDKTEVKGTGLILKRVKINSWNISTATIIESLKIIEQAEKPILIHCLHGSDRTGIVIAAYRMIYEGWSKDAAIGEFMEPRFGYHQTWFPKMLRLLQNLDLNYIREQLNK